MIVDLHADTPLLMKWLGYDFLKSHKDFMPMSAWASHIDLPRMKKANIDAQVFGLVALIPEGDPFSTILDMIMLIENVCEKTEDLIIVRRAEELKKAKNKNSKSCLLSIEGVHALKNDLDRAQILIDRGVIAFGFAHFHANEACSPQYGLGANKKQGLKPFGYELLNFLEEKNVIVDLAHINRKGFFDIINNTSGPLWVSHTASSYIYPHWRNIDDEQIRSVADKEGIIGVIFSRHFLGGSSISMLVKHIKHIINIGGIHAPALGSDFDGFIVPVKELRDITDLPKLCEVMHKEGLSSNEIDCVMGNNALNFLEKL